MIDFLGDPAGQHPGCFEAAGVPVADAASVGANLSPVGRAY